MFVSLLRHLDSSQSGVLDPESGELTVIHRERAPIGPPYWLPEVASHGWFDHLGGVTVSVYREPGNPDTLWLQAGSQRWPLSDGVTSAFSPDLPNDDPQLESADVTRTFTLRRGAATLFEHTYTLNDRERRLQHGMDPFPSWPDEEENYDLLYFAHRVLAGKRWTHTLAAKGDRT